MAEPASAYVDKEENLVDPTCGLQGWFGVFFSQGCAAVKGKELKAWKIQKVKGNSSDVT